VPGEPKPDSLDRGHFQFLRTCSGQNRLGAGWLARFCLPVARQSNAPAACAILQPTLSKGVPSAGIAWRWQGESLPIQVMWPRVAHPIAGRRRKRLQLERPAPQSRRKCVATREAPYCASLMGHCYRNEAGRNCAASFQHQQQQTTLFCRDMFNERSGTRWQPELKERAADRRRMKITAGLQGSTPGPIESLAIEWMSRPNLNPSRYEDFLCFSLRRTEALQKRGGIGGDSPPHPVPLYAMSQQPGGVDGLAEPLEHASRVVRLLRLDRKRRSSPRSTSPAATEYLTMVGAMVVPHLRTPVNKRLPASTQVPPIFRVATFLPFSGTTEQSDRFAIVCAAGNRGTANAARAAR